MWLRHPIWDFGPRTLPSELYDFPLPSALFDSILLNGNRSVLDRLVVVVISGAALPMTREVEPLLACAALL